MSPGSPMRLKTIGLRLRTVKVDRGSEMEPGSFVWGTRRCPGSHGQRTSNAHLNSGFDCTADVEDLRIPEFRRLRASFRKSRSWILHPRHIVDSPATLADPYWPFISAKEFMSARHGGLLIDTLSHSRSVPTLVGHQLSIDIKFPINAWSSGDSRRTLTANQRNND
jgi:hypothetical protein